MMIFHLKTFYRIKKFVLLLAVWNRVPLVLFYLQRAPEDHIGEAKFSQKVTNSKSKKVPQIFFKKYTTETVFALYIAVAATCFLHSRASKMKR